MLFGDRTVRVTATGDARTLVNRPTLPVGHGCLPSLIDWNTRGVSLHAEDKLNPKSSSYLRQSPKRLLGATLCNHGQVVQVMEAAKMAGLSKLAIAVKGGGR